MCIRDMDKMSRGLFNDSIRTFEVKEASELLQGVWLVEIGELDAVSYTHLCTTRGNHGACPPP